LALLAALPIYRGVHPLRMRHGLRRSGLDPDRGSTGWGRPRRADGCAERGSAGHTVIVLPVAGPAPRPDRPSTVLLHDEPDVRIVRFHLTPGQEVPPHTSPSSVVIQVLEGMGTFDGADGSVTLGPGDTVVYAPNELHSMRADREEPLRFLAVITPRPG